VNHLGFLQIQAPLLNVGTKPMRKQRPTAMWTMFATWALLLVYAVCTHGFNDVWWITHHLLSGDLKGAQMHDPLMRMGPFIAAMVVIMLPACLATTPLVRRFHKVKGEHANEGMFAASTPKRQFAIIMTMLFAEEVLAREIFLGQGSRIPHFSGITGFILLFVLGNGIWSLIHLFNFKNKADWNPILVLPQFVAGFFPTLVYIPYGFFGALMAHVIYDMILFAADRKDVFNAGEKALVAYHSVAFLLAYCMFFFRGDQSLYDMKHWFDENAGSFALPGWEFADYFWATILITSFFTLIGEMLLYDREGGEKKWNVVDDLNRIFLFGILSWSLVPLIEHVAPGDSSNMMIKVFVVAIIGSFAIKSASGSGVARVFWESLLIVPVLVCSMLALDYHTAVLLILAYVGYLAIDRVIRYLDKDDLPVQQENSAASGV
jgi:hypothetical protein